MQLTRAGDVFLAQAGALLDRMKVQTGPLEGTVVFPGMDGSIPCEVRFKAGIDPSVSGGSSRFIMHITAERPTNTRRLEGDGQDPQLDADPLARSIFSGFGGVCNGSVLPTYENVSTGTDQQFDFRVPRDVEVDTSYSYNGQAKVRVSLFRSGLSAGETLPQNLTLGLAVCVDGMSNDQPVTRKGESYFDGNDFVTAPADVFRDYGYRLSDELGHDALAQVIAVMLEARLIAVL